MSLLLTRTLVALPETVDQVVVEAPANSGLFDLLDGGIMVYPLLACAALVLGMSAWTASRLWGRTPDAGPRTRVGVDAVLFWGAFAMVLGVLGTLVGIMVAAEAVEAVGEVHASLVWGGIRMALITTVVGTLVLAAASLLWFGLRLRCRLLEARPA
jgi:hypothetical protein